MATLALFDFDGTITFEDTYTKFLIYSTPKLRLLIGFTILLPLILLYKAKLMSSARLRPILTMFAFAGRNANTLEQLGSKFAATHLNPLVRPQAAQALNWHRQQGHTIVIVSASLNVYLTPWANQQGVELVCSELAVKNKRVTGRYRFGDCCLANKVALLKRSKDLSQYQTIYAYGDTPEDFPMLALADHKYYRWQKS